MNNIESKDLKVHFFDLFVLKAHSNYDDGAKTILEDLVLNNKSELSIGALIDFLNFDGNLDDLSTYSVLESAISDNESISFIKNMKAQSSKLAYYKALVEQVKTYANSRKLKMERYFDEFINRGVDIGTINYAEFALSGKIDFEEISEYIMDILELNKDINAIVRAELTRLKNLSKEELESRKHIND